VPQKSKIFAVFNHLNLKKIKSNLNKMKLKNPRVVIYSVIALGFIVLGFLVSYWFIIGAIVLMILNQRELMKKNK
jgi:hypothetical protein